jgi:DNA (cytosine-5)-methyltransferase 1
MSHNGRIQSGLNSYTKTLPDADKVYVIDFFSGCGGMSWGFANTRQSHLAFEVLAGIDIDEQAIATYNANLQAPGVVADIREIAERPERLMDVVPGFDPNTSRPLVFIGCPPCQGFSAHRKKDDRDDPRNDLFLCFASICDFYKPDVIVMENVPEIIKGRYSRYFEGAASALQRSGYTLSLDILDLSRFGVPQRRKRAIVIGALEGKINLPEPIFSDENVLTVRHAISHLNPVATGEADPNDPFHKAPAHTARILELIKKIPHDGGDRRALSEEDQLSCHIALDRNGTKGFTDVYGRLRWDSPSVTITAKSSTPSCGRFLHPEQDRNITVREAAILQSFPQHYRFEGPFVNQYRQIGEAVPPLFARFLAWQILDHIRPRDVSPTITCLKHKELPYKASRNPADSIALVDAFCGAGGISLGFESAGFKTAYAFDIDADSVATFNKNICEVAERADVRDPKLAQVIDERVGSGMFVMVGGPPCQGFSQQRRGAHHDDRNDLVVEYANLIERLNNLPIAIVLENVTYLDSPRGRKILGMYQNKLVTLGYKVFRHDLNSAMYGVPQLRQRIVLVALQEDPAAHYEGPTPLTPKRWLTVGEALAGLPVPKDSSLFGSLISNHDVSREGKLNKRRIAFVDMGGGRMAIPSELQLACHREYKGHLDVYGRLDWFLPARTLTVGFDSFTRGEYAHPFEHRSITHREAARLQGFPDWFAFEGNRASVRRQIGNAVPSLLALAVAKAIRAAIESARIKDLA